jgi:hypothetical protein
MIFLVGLSGCILLGLLMWRHRELFYGWNHGANVGVQESDGVPEHTSQEQPYESHEERGDRESPKGCTHLKSYEPLSRALMPPFIGRRRDFYIPRLPSNLENIRNVNMYMNVFHTPWFAELISIHKPATSSHFKPGLFETTSLTWLPRTSEILFMKIITHRDSRTEVSRNSQVHGFLRFTRFQSSWNKQQNNEPKPSSAINSWNIQKVSNLRRIQRNYFHEHPLATNLEFPIFSQTHKLQ